MLNKRLVMMIGGTATCALGIGFIMQNTVTPSRYVTKPETAQTQIQFQSEARSQTVSSIADDAPLQIDQITLTSAQSGLGESETSEEVRDLPETPKDPDTPRLGCDQHIVAVPVNDAQVQLHVQAPCQANERVTVHHSGMMFTTSTDENGTMTAVIPALAERAVFIVDFATGKDLVATTLVPDLHAHDRVVVQWSGKAGFEIHAREFGASYGETGHVWSGMDQASNRTGSSVVRLGEPRGLNPSMAEIYSFPRAGIGSSGSIQLSVEAEVTLENCGRDVSAQSLELRDGQPLRTRDMTLSVPNCAATGDFLVLNNLLDDLKIAAK
ncbi:MAG: hypothetical protein GJ676_14475 [Rhodobacteraceae bacterium]|nr:hypothetical protein [Paracoccaceae bacterium]